MYGWQYTACISALKCPLIMDDSPSGCEWGGAPRGSRDEVGGGGRQRAASHPSSDDRAARLFLRACRNNGIRCERTDGLITERFGTVEVKAPQRLGRHRRVSNVFATVELQTAEDRHGVVRPGWVFGRSDHIAFASPNWTEFIVVRTAALASTVQSWKNWPTTNYAIKSLEPFTTHSREGGRGGVVVYVPYVMLLNMATRVLKVRHG